MALLDRSRASMALGRAITVLIALAPSASSAQAIDRPLAHLQQDHWTARHGVPASGVRRLARSGDGYLWLGSADGLVRFDGVRFVGMDSTYDDVFRTTGVSYSTLDDTHPAAARDMSAGLTLPLLSDADGALWVAPPDGRLVRYSNGDFEVVLPHDSAVGRINEVVRDGTGQLWVLGSLRGRLYQLREGRLIPPDLPPGVPRDGIAAIIRDTGTGLWIGTFSGRLWHVAGREVASYRPDSTWSGPARPLHHAADGALWVQARTLYRMRDGRWSPVEASDTSRLAVTSIVELPGGSFITGTRGTGLVRWKNGRTDRLLEQDGLSSDAVNRVLLDGEGSLWVATDAGLDRLRAAPFVTISARNGLPLTSPATLQLDGDGSLWVSSTTSPNVVQKLDPSRVVERLRASVARVTNPPSEGFYTPFAALPGDGVILLHNRGALARHRNGRLEPLAIDRRPPGRPTVAHATRDGTVWMGFEPAEFGSVRDGRFRPLALAGGARRGVAAITEDGRGHVWVALADTALIVAASEGRVLASVDASSGLGEPLSVLAAGPGDTLWGAGAESGALIRIADGKASAFASRELTRLLRGATPTIVPHASALWFASGSGIARLSYAGLEVPRGGPGPQPQRFSALDGLTVARAGRMLFGPAVADRAGRIWFSTPSGLATVDPATLMPNAIAPRVHIEEIAVAGARVVRGRPMREGSLELASNPDRVDIRFTATALLVPERVRLEYRLVGADRQWVDGSASRVASYTQLRPGRYQFRVRAWNEDGVPGANEASVEFTVARAWYETYWFVAFALLAFTALVSGGAFGWQRSRARQREAHLRARFEATLQERARVARELHDTLLSGFTGITLQLQALQRKMGPAPPRAAESLSTILTSADAALREARMMIWDLRDVPVTEGGLVAALERAARDAVAGTSVDTRIAVHGDARELSPLLETTLLRVAREAVVNAVRHADARLVRLELTYHPDRVEVRVADDGRGYAPDASGGASLPGHWGLAGMRERAARAGGTVRVTGRIGEGTEVSVSLPTVPAA